MIFSRCLAMSNTQPLRAVIRCDPVLPSRDAASWGGHPGALRVHRYLMGVSPGVKTEFWEWPDMDFCADLAKWVGPYLHRIPASRISNLHQ